MCQICTLFQFCSEEIEDSEKKLALTELLELSELFQGSCQVFTAFIAENSNPF